MRVRVNQARCEAAGWCSRAAPDYFGRDERGFTVLLDAEVDTEDEDLVAGAIDMCPTGTIEWASSGDEVDA